MSFLLAEKRGGSAGVATNRLLLRSKMHLLMVVGLRCKKEVKYLLNTIFCYCKNAFSITFAPAEQNALSADSATGMEIEEIIKKSLEKPH
jgi:hypothetical protein